MAKENDKKISELAKSLPARFTASNRIKEFPTEKSKSCIAQLIGNNDDLYRKFPRQVDTSKVEFLDF